jgi:hypothetical protein
MTSYKEKQQNLFRRYEISTGQHFGEESILGMICPDSNWFIKLDEMKIYDIKCLTFGSELLIFDVWSIVMQIKIEK